MNKISTSTKSSAVEHKRLSEPVGFMLVLLFAALTVYVSSLAYYSFVSAGDYYTGTIAVSGHGSIDVKPDVQKLSIEIAPAVLVSGSATTTPKAATSTADYVKKVLSVLKSKGIPDFDIKIQTLGSIVVKLHGENMLNAKTIAEDVEKVSTKRITTTLEDPTVENIDQMRSRALDMALNDAKMNAMRVSQSLGADLGKVVSFYDNNDNGSGYDNSSVLSNSTYVDNSDSQTITSDITVTYQTK